MNERIADRLRKFEETCRQRGLPLTVQRRTVLEVVIERNDHPTADQVFDTVLARLPRISRTTVYRVLDKLAGLGLIRRVHHPGACVRFDGKIHCHHHLVCLQCNKIFDYEDAALDAIPWPQEKLHGFEISDFSVQFMGICPDCREKEDNS